jgi:hypothetical protein
LPWQIELILEGHEMSLVTETLRTSTITEELSNHIYKAHGHY